MAAKWRAAPKALPSALCSDSFKLDDEKQRSHLFRHYSSKLAIIESLIVLEDIEGAWGPCRPLLRSHCSNHNETSIRIVYKQCFNNLGWLDSNMKGFFPLKYLLKLLFLFVTDKFHFMFQAVCGNSDPEWGWSRERGEGSRPVSSLAICAGC